MKTTSKVSESLKKGNYYLQVHTRICRISGGKVTHVLAPYKWADIQDDGDVSLVTVRAAVWAEPGPITDSSARSPAFELPKGLPWARVLSAFEAEKGDTLTEDDRYVLGYHKNLRMVPPSGVTASPITREGIGWLQGMSGGLTLKDVATDIELAYLDEPEIPVFTVGGDVWRLPVNLAGKIPARKDVREKVRSFTSGKEVRVGVGGNAVLRKDAVEPSAEDGWVEASEYEAAYRPVWGSVPLLLGWKGPRPVLIENRIEAICAHSWEAWA